CARDYSGYDVVFAYW
nr:immunoglobulin heavy chain junction region [Mus musculus]